LTVRSLLGLRVAALVGCAFPSTRHAVDPGAAATRPQRVADQDQIDAQAAIAPERALPVIPPRIVSAILFEQPKAVVQAERVQARKCRAFWRRAQHLLVPQRGIVHVAVVRRDVEVAEHDHFWKALQLGREPVVHLREPIEFVRIFFAADRLAVDDVQVDDADVTDRRDQDAPLRVGEAADVGDDVARRLARQQRDSVVGLLPGKHAQVAKAGQLGIRKLRVFEFRLLQRDDIRRRLREPGAQVRQTDVQRVDVP